jgi:CheY-like chemotaxis protein
MGDVSPLPVAAATVLVVDDSAVDRKLATNMLEKAGHIVSSVSSGEAALALLGDGSVDLVLLDVNLPGVSGFDVLVKLRQQAHTRDIPIIMMSSDQAESRIVRCVPRR